ncbi:hypothetical protein IT412_03930 [Candidatus Peregrinibacteria bacterium]|nr:hypothetical protein [Candidatus Peregrinibacteria bacterium]
MKKILEKLDHQIIKHSGMHFTTVGRLALFIVYFWFGLLKVLGLSPASPLVAALLEKTIPFLTPDQFIFYFGLLEMLIGLLFLIPRLSRVVIAILVLHLITTAGPLFLLPQITWQGFLIPTLEGQYIIKNLLIIATAMGIVGGLKPWKSQK